jgi:hypothetical protein
LAIPVVDAVERDLAELEQRQPGISKTAEAAAAVALARELDRPNSATSKSMCVRALNETMALLRASVPPPAPAVDPLADLERSVKKTRSAR